MDEALKILEILIYIGLMPIIFLILRDMRIEEMFKKGTNQKKIAVFYIILTIVISKVLGDFIIYLVNFNR